MMRRIFAGALVIFLNDGDGALDMLAGVVTSWDSMHRERDQGNWTQVAPR